MINKFKIMSLTETDNDFIKIAMSGCITYENKKKIRDMLFKLKNTFGDKLIIISGGNNAGADKYVRKFAIEMGISYREFNPAYTVKNLYSAMPDSYYSKPYHVSQLFHRNELIARYCDKMIVFNDTTGTSKSSTHLVNMAQKHSKPVIIINEKV
jgi:predicted Rossmann-fold nucleotide-binding protein